MNYIELFAGCGGLSLGLESQNFELFFANELSPMASETYAYNILGVDLQKGLSGADKVLWLSSNHPRSKLNARLNENPQQSVGIDGHISDLDDVKDMGSALKGALLVGSIVDLNRVIARRKILKAVKAGLHGEGVDLVSGGPPCQSFSMAGLRQQSNERNSLPWAFAEFVRQVKPKMAMLENVSGILRAFNINGKKYYAWYEVAKAFAIEGYVPLCLHVNAKYVGAAQNRPRFIMLAFRKDIALKILKTVEEPELLSALKESVNFYKLAHNENENLNYGRLRFHDVDNGSTLYENPIFAPLILHKDKKPLVSVEEAIDDLDRDDQKKSEYVHYINEWAYGEMPASIGEPENNEPRRNNDTVRARFRLYQLMRNLSPKARKEISNFLKSGDKTTVAESSLNELRGSGWFMTVQGRVVKKPSISQLFTQLELMRTKKQTQRALFAKEPAPAALSIPDDACHYREDLDSLRTLTVREMARIQSFPDWFVFRSKVTTGGHMRRFQVPQYTQVGNAVPPLLGKALGKVCKDLLDLAG